MIRGEPNRSYQPPNFILQVSRLHGKYATFKRAFGGDMRMIPLGGFGRWQGEPQERRLTQQGTAQVTIESAHRPPDLNRL